MESSAQQRLSDLFKGLIQVPAGLDCWVADIQQDSRKITQGALFVAAEGIGSNGSEYIKDAIQRGAIAVLKPGPDQQVYEDNNVIFIEIEKVKPLVGEIAHRFFGWVTRTMQVVGVTGTNGKSSVTHYIAQLAQLLGIKAAVIGTLGYGAPDKLLTTTHTTPDAVSVHRHLFELHEQGYEFVAMEVSSHALDQHRVAGIKFITSVFTNLSRDHLDYHGTMENYAEVKKRLFAMPGVCPVLNFGDPLGQKWAEEMATAGTSCIGYSASKISGTTIWAEDVSYHADGIDFKLSSDAFCFDVHTSLLGSFNLENLLAAVAALIDVGQDIAKLARYLPQLKPVSGRMESLPGNEKLPAVVLDYAHTPDALEAVLKALRGGCGGQLWCVFGCGGNRDKGKRPLMGEVAGRWADQIVLTDDNPRSEEPGSILADIMQGVREQNKARIVQPRDQAIALALHQADARDIVLIAGKGHESYQEINGKKHYFSDRETAASILADQEMQGKPPADPAEGGL